MRYLSEDQLIDAVKRRIISPAQYDALLQMEPSDLPPHMGHAGGILDIASTAEMATSRDTPRGFNWITIAYYLGALTVMFAFGWFLIDRWRALGPLGILAVTTIYAVLFLVTGEYLRRQGYRVAGALVTGLAVGMVPLIVWAIQKQAGLWPDRSPPFPGAYELYPRADTRQTALNVIMIEIATIVATAAAFRKLRFGFLLAPGVIAFAFLPLSILMLARGEESGPHASAWTWAATGGILLTIAFAIDRRDRDRADFAYWPYLAGVIISLVSIAQTWDLYPSFRHLLPVIGLLIIAASLTLRRVIFLAFGGVLVYAYLAWLSFDLFRSSTFFPIVLATLGLSIILAAVWMQRTYPRLVARVNAGLSDPRPWLPGGYVIPASLIVLSLVMIIASGPRDSAIMASRAEDMRRMREDTVAGPRRAPRTAPVPADSVVSPPPRS